MIALAINQFAHGKPPPVQQPSDDELELDREMEYLVEPEEAEARGITEVE